VFNQEVDGLSECLALFSIKQISVEDTLNIRQQILRPTLNASDCVFPGDYEESTHHFGAFFAKELVSIVSLFNQKLDNCSLGKEYQIRAMATLEKYQGQGIGYRLLCALEAYASDQGIDYLWANARITAQEFYRKAGYNVDQKIFMIEGVGEHVLVSKSLNVK
jgi:GNAT superfamily N-acetyltransferase